MHGGVTSIHSFGELVGSIHSPSAFCPLHPLVFSRTCQIHPLEHHAKLVVEHHASLIVEHHAKGVRPFRLRTSITRTARSHSAALLSEERCVLRAGRLEVRVRAWSASAVLDADSGSHSALRQCQAHLVIVHPIRVMVIENLAHFLIERTAPRRRVERRALRMPTDYLPWVPRSLHVTSKACACVSSRKLEVFPDYVWMPSGDPK